MIAKVIKSTGKTYLLELENGSIIRANLKGKIRLNGERYTNPVAAGDKVDVSVNEENGFTIDSVLPRINFLMRKSTNLSKQKQILASNVDHIFLIATVKHPVTQLNFINRILVSAESYRIPTTILFNKIDLYSPEDNKMLEEWVKIFTQIGYECHSISSKQEDTIAFLKDKICNKQVMFVGNSGVGKSSLVKAIDHRLNIRIGEISNSHEQGKHTTTFAEMHRLSFGGYVIDTPGIRAFGLIDLNKEHYSHYFPEMRERMDTCKFHNCLHLNEPHCAIKEAVEKGEISTSRYQTYIHLMEEDNEDPYRRNDHL